MRRRTAVAAAAGALLVAGMAGWVAAQEPTSPGADSATPSAEVAPPASNTTGEAALESASPPDESAPPPEADTAVEPAAPAVPEPPPAPLPRPRFESIVLQATDKVTAETLRFEARVGESVRYRGLVVTVRACEATAADEAQEDQLGYVEVRSEPVITPGRQAVAARELFHGWMSASSPGLNPLQSPGYDLSVVACKTVSAPPAAAGQA